MPNQRVLLLKLLVFSEMVLILSRWLLGLRSTLANLVKLDRDRLVKLDLEIILI